ncbi:hypothetical protein Hanom_Chr09g00785991 [Helianthus anomalus]
MKLEAGSKLATKPKHQVVKWLFLKVWGKTVKVTKPQGAKRKFTLCNSSSKLSYEPSKLTEGKPSFSELQTQS